MLHLTRNFSSPGTSTRRPWRASYNPTLWKYWMRHHVTLGSVNDAWKCKWCPEVQSLSLPCREQSWGNTAQLPRQQNLKLLDVGADAFSFKASFPAHFKLQTWKEELRTFYTSRILELEGSKEKCFKLSAMIHSKKNTHIWPLHMPRSNTNFYTFSSLLFILF